MAWKDNLLDASFRNVALEVISCEASGGHEVAKHAYPYRAGIETEDLGLKERVFQFSVALWGDDYETPLQQLLQALSMEGIGELVHPVWGSIWVQPVDWSEVFQAEDPDYVALKITFWEASKPTDLFIRQSPTLVAEAAVMADEPVLAAATDALASEIDTLSLSGALEQIQSVRTLMTDTLSGVQSEVAGAIRSVTDVIDVPRGFCSDMIDGISGALNTANRLNPKDLFGGWSGLLDDAQRMGRMPGNLFKSWQRDKSGTAPQARDVRSVERFQRAAASSQVASSAAAVLVSEVKTPTLTPPQIEAMVGDVRTEIQTTIALLRPQVDEVTEPSFNQAQQLLLYRPVIEALKAQALAVQQAGAVVLERRPPLGERVVPFAGNWHLLAHEWYGDYSRADELARLNPQVTLANNLQRGDVVNAYAR